MLTTNTTTVLWPQQNTNASMDIHHFKYIKISFDHNPSGHNSPIFLAFNFYQCKAFIRLKCSVSIYRITY